MDFVQESNFFLSAFLTEIISEKIVLRYCGKKNNDYKRKKLNFKTGQKMDISKEVSPWILSKIELSLTAFFHKNYVRRDRFWIF